MLLVLGLLAGCAGMDGRSGGQGPSSEDLARIQAGVTDAGGVKTLLGPPLRVSRNDRMAREVWEYRRYDDPMNDWHIAVQFSGDGIAREVVKVRDLSRELCGP